MAIIVTDLKAERVQIYLEWIPDWQHESDASGFAPGTDALVRKFNLKDKAAALDFARLICEVAKRHSHFPEIDVVGSEVCVRITNPGAGLTEKDFEMAVLVDHYYSIA